MCCHACVHVTVIHGKVESVRLLLLTATAMGAQGWQCAGNVLVYRVAHSQLEALGVLAIAALAALDTRTSLPARHVAHSAKYDRV